MTAPAEAFKESKSRSTGPALPHAPESADRFAFARSQVTVIVAFAAGSEELSHAESPLVAATETENEPGVAQWNVAFPFASDDVTPDHV